jgi:hypothetical protein
MLGGSTIETSDVQEANKLVPMLVSLDPGSKVHSTKPEQLAKTNDSSRSTDEGIIIFSSFKQPEKARWPIRTS